MGDTPKCTPFFHPDISLFFKRFVKAQFMVKSQFSPVIPLIQAAIPILAMGLVWVSHILKIRKKRPKFWRHHRQGATFPRRDRNIVGPNRNAGLQRTRLEETPVKLRIRGWTALFLVHGFHGFHRYYIDPSQSINQSIK